MQGSPMTSQQLADRIRKLCEKALKAEQDELESLIQELRAMLHEHNKLMRELVAERLKHPLPIPDSALGRRNGH